MNTELESLLNSIRRDMMDIIANVNANDRQGAKELAAAVCVNVADYQARVKMAQESAGVGRYDLATLPPPVAVLAEEDPESRLYEA